MMEMISMLRNRHCLGWFVTAVCVVLLTVQASRAASTMAEEFRIKRQGPFEFAEKPTVTKDGDQVTIRFKTKAFCDVTVAIEDSEGKILRHLASGVLGKNPPPPFQKESLAQTILWDSKDDKGEYYDDIKNTVIRVSLGLKPRFERHYLWSPHRRWESGTPGVVWPPSFVAQPEGVYVFDGVMTDFIYLFDHAGNYVRTVYPFPSDKLDKLVGVRKRVFEQSGKTLPWKSGHMRSSLLTGGGNTRFPNGDQQVRSGGNSAMAIRNGQIALAYLGLNTLATDGTTGGRPLEGPETHLPKQGYYPRSVALSPDGNTAYVTGFHRRAGVGATARIYWLRGVGKVDVANGKKGDKMQTFAGALTNNHKIPHAGPGEFKAPSSVDVDPQGRVYVTDHFNNRVQVFDPSGKHLKDIAISKPSEVCIDPRNGEIYVFAWALDDHAFRAGGDGYGKGSETKPTLTHLGPFDNPKVRATYAFPIVDQTLAGGRHGGTRYRGIVNFWAPGDAQPQIWLVSGAHPRFGTSSTHHEQIRILRRKANTNTLEVVKDFTQQAQKDRGVLHSLSRSHLEVNPKTGNLWVLRGPVVIDPDTGKYRSVKLPQGMSEMAFDLDGHAYLSTGTMVSRFTVSPTGQWREVPFDYGEAIGGRISALATLGGPFHIGGITVSPKGNIVASVGFKPGKSSSLDRGKNEIYEINKPWTPMMYPGRGGHNVVRVWDRYGKMLFDDAVPGVGYTHNIYMDKDDKLYVATGGQREGYTDVNTGTLIKVRPGSKILTTDSVLPLRPLPTRPPDTRLGQIGGKAWWENAEWLYGGIGFNGKNRGGVAACHCAQFRVTQDYFARTFVPETVHYTVGVLDSAGNLVMRIGQYGNIDDGVPMVADPRIPKPRSLGGDEVALFHPAYLAVHTDKRLFINDPGNDRIVSVKLGYHASERVSLRDVPGK